MPAVEPAPAFLGAHRDLDGHPLLAVDPPQDEHLRALRRYVQVVALALIAMEHELVPGMKPLLHAGLVDQKPRRAGFGKALHHADRFPGVIGPATLQCPSLHHYRNREIRFFHGRLVSPDYTAARLRNP